MCLILKCYIKVYCIKFFYIRVFDTEHLLFIRIFLWLFKVTCDLYIHNKYTQNTHIHYLNKNLM